MKNIHLYVGLSVSNIQYVIKLGTRDALLSSNYLDHDKVKMGWLLNLICVLHGMYGEQLFICTNPCMDSEPL